MADILPDLRNWLFDLWRRNVVGNVDCRTSDCRLGNVRHLQRRSAYCGGMRSDAEETKYESVAYWFRAVHSLTLPTALFGMVMGRECTSTGSDSFY